MTRIGSLFTGAAMLDLAVHELLDAEPAWFVENDPAASKVLAHNFPGIPNYGDITTVDWATVEPVEILCGGYPCQPFSSAGRRQGVDDVRHLWPYAAAAVGHLRPELVFFENVRGHLTLGFDQVVRDLSLLHYELRWMVLRAADIGAPHGRSRMFILGRDCGRQLRSRVSGWRGIYRDRACQGCGHVCNSGCDRDGNEIVTDLDDDETALWWAAESDEAGDRTERVEDTLEGRRVGGVCVSNDDPTVLDPEEDSSRCLHRVARTNMQESCRTWSSPLVQMSACESECGEEQDSRSEQARTRSSAAVVAEPGAVCGVPVGRLVGACRELIRSSRVHGTLADKRDDGRGTRVRDADSTMGYVITAWPAAHTQRRELQRRGISGVLASQERTGEGEGAQRQWNRDTTRDGCTAPGDTDRLDSERRPTAELKRETRPTPRLATDSDSIGLQGNERGPRTTNMRRRPTDETGTIAADANSVGPLRCGGPRGGWSGSPDHREPPTEPESDGWGEGRPESAGQFWGSDVALSGDATTPDTSGARRETRSRVHERTGPTAIRDDPSIHNPRSWIAADGTDYGPAIYRWETILGRAAPDPMQTGPRGGQKLSGRFTEWMMGWPQGWVTDVPGVSLNDQIRMCGNGVVPRQAVAAMRHLLCAHEWAA